MSYIETNCQLYSSLVKRPSSSLPNHGGGELLLCLDVDCDPGLEVDGEVILENCNPSALVEFAKIKIDKNCET